MLIQYNAMQRHVGLDHLHSLQYGVSIYLLQKVQFVQNAAACLITGTRRYERVAPVLQKVARASCSSNGRVQARVPGSPVAGWTDTVVP